MRAAVVRVAVSECAAILFKVKQPWWGRLRALFCQQAGEQQTLTLKRVPNSRTVLNSEIFPATPVQLYNYTTKQKMLPLCSLHTVHTVAASKLFL